MRQTQTSFNNVSEQIINDLWTEAKGLDLSEEWTGVQDSRSYVQGFLMDTSVEMEDQRKSQRPQDQTAYGQKLGHNDSGNRNEKMQDGQKKVPNCKQHTANRGIYEVLTDDKDFFNSIAEARRKLENGCFSCHAVKGKQSRETSDLLKSHRCQHGTVRFRKQRSLRESEPKTYGPHCRKRYVGGFHCGLVHKPVSIQEVLKVPEAKDAV